MKTKETQTSVVIMARARAFSGQGMRYHNFLVTGNDIKVWDPIAGHYTSCHSMDAETLARIAAIAAEEEVA